MAGAIRNWSAESLLGACDAHLAALMPQVASIVRLAPLPMVAHGCGPTIIFPPDNPAMEVFALLGAAIAVDSEEAFDCLFASTSMMGSFFAMLETQAHWLERKGVPYRGHGAISDQSSGDLA
jgi:pyrroline-5-carboxylate reductase